MRALVFLLTTVILSTLASASATAWLWSPATVPLYFSGTNCKVQASVVISGGGTHGFSEAFISLNGSLAWHWQSNEPVQQHLSHLLTFDSTHFAPGSTVVVAFGAKGDDGNWYYAQPYEVQVINRAAVYGRYDLEVPHVTFVVDSPTSGHYVVGTDAWEGCPSAKTYYESMSYDARKVTTLGWTHPIYTQSTFAQDLQWATSVYINTHGAPLPNSWTLTDPRRTTFFNDDYDDVAPFWLAGETDPRLLPSGTTITGTYVVPKILPLREVANGTGLPPTNSGGPPISLAWVDGCKSGLGSEDLDPATGLDFVKNSPVHFFTPCTRSTTAPPLIKRFAAIESTSHSGAQEPSLWSFLAGCYSDGQSIVLGSSPSDNTLDPTARWILMIGWRYMAIGQPACTVSTRMKMIRFRLPHGYSELANY